MKNKWYYISGLLMMILLSSCATRRFSTNYYQENQVTLTRIEESYRAIYGVHRFSVEFTDRSFNYISLEIITDSIKYIYEFEINEARLNDTLVKYGLPVEQTVNLVKEMKSIKCIWINMLDYYANNSRKDYLVFMSIRNAGFHLPFTSEKYYILTFYSQPQYYDAEGRLLAGRTMRRLRRINDEIFHRINDKVCYTVSGRFR